MELDPRTIIFTATMASLVMMVVLFVQARSFPESIKGIKTWASALLVGTIAAIVFAAWGSLIPERVSSVMGNGLLVTSVGLIIAAMSQFHHRPIPWKFPFASVIFIMLVMYYTTGFQYSAAMRTAIGSGLNIILFSLATWSVFSGRVTQKFQFGIYFTACCFASLVMVCIARMTTAFLWPEQFGGLLSDGLMQRVYLVAYSVNILLASVGFSIMGHEKMVEGYRNLARFDVLTGLYNRRYFIETAEREVQRTERYGGSLSLILLDIDKFKSINDTYGHQTGDDVIRDIADVMRQNFRETDRFGRYGGEEFLALLPETQLADAVNVAERMRKAIQQRTVSCKKGEISYTASFGVVQYSAEMSLDELIDQADKALYHAKNTGRNRVEVFSSDVELAP